MIILKDKTKLEEIRTEHNHFFQKMVKIVVDIKENKLALNAELQADLESLLLEEGSEQENLWGANIYFEGPVYVEFNSLINIRPSQNNPSMDVLDENIQKDILTIVDNWIDK